MLEPNDRRHLLESLKPPEGYQLSCAIGTTFSLDLLTLLTVPLAFARFDWEDQEGRPAADPLAILEALRRYANRVSIFCQAGQISIPKSDQLLYNYLEGSVIEVTAPASRGVFHPKVWILRFTAPNNPVLYRVLCLSRNLTFDRSWDTALVLDGELIGRKKAFARNHPLGDFVSALPGLALRPVPNRIQANIALVQDELRRVQFEPPNGFESIAFWSMGINNKHPWPFDGRIDRLLVVSPFVSEGCLSWLTEQSESNILISRLESLEPLDRKRLKDFTQVYFLSPDAVTEEEQSEENAIGTDSPLAGLHAKLYLAETGWNARVWTGSANATNSAFEQNVEFLVEMSCKKSRFGIDAFLCQERGKASFRDLLQEFKPSKSATPVDSDLERLQQMADNLRRVFVTACPIARVSPSERDGTYCILLYAQNEGVLSMPPGATARCWPISLPEAAAATIVSCRPGLMAEFDRLSLEAITSFFAFDIEVSLGQRKARSRFVLNVLLEGAPGDRRERILRSLLRNKDQVLRFLLFILAEGDADMRDLISDIYGNGPGKLVSKHHDMGLALFEPLVRALVRDPTKLDQVARLVDDLKKPLEGQQLLPEGFDSIWEPIWIARQRLIR